jgi:hypothetical protein
LVSGDPLARPCPTRSGSPSGHAVVPAEGDPDEDLPEWTLVTALRSAIRPCLADGHPGTAPETLEAVASFAIEIGQVPVPVRKEQNGYVLDTWLVALLNAAQSLVTEGVATHEDVDRTYMIANRGCAMGPVGMLDMIGGRRRRADAAQRRVHEGDLPGQGQARDADGTRLLQLSASGLRRA